MKFFSLHKTLCGQKNVIIQTWNWHWIGKKNWEDVPHCPWLYFLYPLIQELLIQCISLKSIWLPKEKPYCKKSSVNLTFIWSAAQMLTTDHNFTATTLNNMCPNDSTIHCCLFYLKWFYLKQLIWNESNQMNMNISVKLIKWTQLNFHSVFIRTYKEFACFSNMSEFICGDLVLKLFTNKFLFL